jgi:hypothetical protein
LCFFFNFPPNICLTYMWCKTILFSLHKCLLGSKKTWTNAELTFLTTSTCSTRITRQKNHLSLQKYVIWQNFHTFPHFRHVLRDRTIPGRDGSAGLTM